MFDSAGTYVPTEVRCSLNFNSVCVHRQILYIFI